MYYALWCIIKRFHSWEIISIQQRECREIRIVWWRLIAVGIRNKNMRQKKTPRFVMAEHLSEDIMRVISVSTLCLKKNKSGKFFFVRTGIELSSLVLRD